MVGGSMNHCPPRLTPKSARDAIHCHRVTANTMGTNDATIRRPAKMLIFLLSFTFCETLTHSGVETRAPISIEPMIRGRLLFPGSSRMKVIT